MPEKNMAPTGAPSRPVAEILKDRLVAEHKMRKLTLVDKGWAKPPMPNGLADQDKFRKMSRLILIVVMALLVASWTALTRWLPGLVSVPTAVAGAFWSCVMLAVVWYFAVKHLATD